MNELKFYDKIYYQINYLLFFKENKNRLDKKGNSSLISIK